MAAKSQAVSRADELVSPAWAVIVPAVEEGHPLIYTPLATAVGSHRQSPTLHGALAVIQEQCHKRAWPDLSTAVVGARSGVPGVGRLGRRETRAQWSQDWDTMRPFPWLFMVPTEAGMVPK